MRLQEQRWVKASQKDACDFTADFSHIARWDPGVVSSHKTTPGPVGEGSEFDLEVKLGRGTVPMRYRITEFEPDSRVVLVGEGEQLTAVDEILFDTQDNLTRIDYTADLTFHNYMRYLEPLLGAAIRKVGARALDGLAEALAE